ncbi:DUF493 domain-containing protein [Sphingobacterium sp. JB170]|uniref:DUF493 domain-containing protein n=1 Tax=Sphingobacterium sp. JB170 TaxID=1434842 RepID=UPI00097F3FE9|nr:DUF493 domain-containing protein [Sphingobacterium sp. JB170]SJN33552.1 hypothetical protein FM107_07815 [Sphingobacterium sp. JB170]
MSDFKNINIQDLSNNEGTNNENFYDTFREKLKAVEQFPMVYRFKFIIKSDLQKVEEVKAIFTHPSSKFSEKASSKGKYNSITVETFVNSADEVIDYYKKVSAIESVIML